MKILGSTMHEIIDATNTLSTGNIEELYFRCGEIEIARTTRKIPRGGPWIFKLTEDFTLETDCTGITFRSDWFMISEDGRMTIRKGYAWDGNSVKIDVFDLFIIGTPDGVIDVQTMKPKTWYASLVHDALYQYYGYHGSSVRRWTRSICSLPARPNPPPHRSTTRLYACSGGPSTSGSGWKF